MFKVNLTEPYPRTRQPVQVSDCFKRLCCLGSVIRLLAGGCTLNRLFGFTVYLVDSKKTFNTAHPISSRRVSGCLACESMGCLQIATETIREFGRQD